MAQEFAVLERDALARRVDPIDERWKGYAYLALAIEDAPQAWRKVQHELQFFDDGSSRTTSLYWIATRP